MSNLVFSVEYFFVVSGEQQVKYREFKNANLFLVLYTNILNVTTVDQAEFQIGQINTCVRKQLLYVQESNFGENCTNT